MVSHFENMQRQRKNAENALKILISAQQLSPLFFKIYYKSVKNLIVKNVS